MQRKLRLVADIAFLLKPSAHTPPVTKVSDWIAGQRQTGGALVIGCNINPQPLLSEGGEPETLLAAYVEAVKLWFHQFNAGFSAVILPHDYRPKHREVEISERFHQMLPAEIKERVLLIRERLGAADAKAIAAQCDLFLTGRMHLAVAALGNSKPVICLGYQCKFEGMLAHFGLEELVLPWREALVPERLAGWGSEILSRRMALTEQVARKLPEVIKLSRANLDAYGSGHQSNGFFSMRGNLQLVS